MKCVRITPRVALLLLLAPAMNASAQITTLSTRTAIAPDTTITVLTRRIEALEATIAELQQKLAFIKSVNPLVLDPGGDVRIRANQIELDAGMAFTLRAATGATINSSNTVLIQAGAALDLKGSSIRHNNGSVPIACAASTVSGQTAAGGGLRSIEHTHGVTLPVTPCSSTVGVPGPGQ